MNILVHLYWKRRKWSERSGYCYDINWVLGSGRVVPQFWVLVEVAFSFLSFTFSINFWCFWIYLINIEILASLLDFWTFYVFPQCILSDFLKFFQTFWHTRFSKWIFIRLYRFWYSKITKHCYCWILLTAKWSARITWATLLYFLWVQQFFCLFLRVVLNWFPVFTEWFRWL